MGDLSIESYESMQVDSSFEDDSGDEADTSAMSRGDSTKTIEKNLTLRMEKGDTFTVKKETDEKEDSDSTVAEITQSVKDISILEENNNES